MTDRVKVASKDEVPAGQGLQVSVNGEKVAIFNVEGEYFAIADRCTHAGASLAQGPLDGTGVLCPWHLAKFDLRSGHALTPPAVEPVACYDVHVDGDEIHVAVKPRSL